MAELGKSRYAKGQKLNKDFQSKCKEAKENYYKNIVMDLKNSQPSQWYSKLKRMSSQDQHKSEEVFVEEISHLPNHVQAEVIANKFSEISNEYQPLESTEISLEDCINKSETPILEPYQVYEYLKRIKTKTSTVKDDIPSKIIKEFAVELSTQLA